MSFINRLKRYMRNEQRTNDSIRGLSDYINEMYNDRINQYATQQPRITTAWQEFNQEGVSRTYTDTQIRMMREIGVDVGTTRHDNSHYIYYLGPGTGIICDVPGFYDINVERLLDRDGFNLYVDIVNGNHQTIKRIKLFLGDNKMYEEGGRLKEYIYLSELIKKVKRSHPLSKHLSDIDKAIFEFGIYAN